jgi:hypothetical protein
MADRTSPRRTADRWVDPAHAKQQRGKLERAAREGRQRAGRSQTSSKTTRSGSDPSRRAK